MAFMQMDIYSKALARTTEAGVCIPERYIGDRRDNHNEADWDKDWGKWPVLWVLHGASSNYSDWWRFSALERYCEEYGFSAVTVSGDLSFYSNINTGRYFDWITEELPAKLAAMLPISTDPKDNFLAGFSMGGHGTAKIGLTVPDRYAAICIMSAGNLLLTGWEHADERMTKDHRLYLGSTVPEDLFGGEHDVYWLAGQAVKAGKPLPKILFTCGIQDIAHEGSVEFYKVLKSLGYDVEFDESEGIHNFDYWDPKIEYFMRWIKKNGLYTDRHPADGDRRSRLSDL